MPDIAKVLREEIQRLARKEVKAAISPLKKDNANLKRTVADHKRRLAQLERDAKQLLAQAKKSQDSVTKTSGDEVEKARITAKMIKSIRNRLGLSQAKLAKILGVATNTVLLWEQKEGRLTFRNPDTKSAIVGLREMTKAEMAELI
jgi:DNA-binding transcriptional regulator YiaG